MSKTVTFSQNPALRMAKEKATTQFTTTKHVLAEGTYKSSIGSFPATRVLATAAGTAERKK